MRPAAAEKSRRMPEHAAVRNEEQQALEQHLKQLKEKEQVKKKKEWSGLVRLETVAGPEGRNGGEESGPYAHYDSPEEVLIGSGYHSHPAVEQPPGKPLYDFTIGKKLYIFVVEQIIHIFLWKYFSATGIIGLLNVKFLIFWKDQRRIPKETIQRIRKIIKVYRTRTN